MPELELVMTLRVEIGPALEVGEVGAGFRRVIRSPAAALRDRRYGARWCRVARTGI